MRRRKTDNGNRENIGKGSPYSSVNAANSKGPLKKKKTLYSNRFIYGRVNK